LPARKKVEVSMADIAHDVARYEQWLRDHCEVVEKDLEAKHERMREDAFVFLRATYFRWARTIESVCPGFSGAPRVLCVGDTHVENFGTWRDGDSRQVWGLNDFDEAAVMPYPFDLVRLVASACLSGKLGVEAERAAGAVLEGYVDGLGAPGPVLLEQGASWFRTLVGQLADKTDEFWEELDALEEAVLPRKVRKSLQRALPEGAVPRRFASRRKGGGGLGRPRFVVIADWQGARVVREAKATVPSAWTWAHSKVPSKSRFLEMAYGHHRAPDTSLHASDGFLLRRVAPDSRKLDLKEVAKRELGVTLLQAMGREIGTVHADHRRAPAIVEDLAQRGSDWLHVAATQAQAAVQADYRAWLATSGAETTRAQQVKPMKKKRMRT
jgi:uncharacterized protein (DUF2252 family)